MSVDKVVNLAAEKNAELLIEHGDKFFADTKTQAELFALLDMCFADLSRMFAGLNERGALTLDDVGTYQWSGVMIQTILRTLRVGPKYDTEALERQLKQNLRSIIKGAPVRDLVQPS